MAALLLSAVCGSGWEAGLYLRRISLNVVRHPPLGTCGTTYVALSAYHLLAVELGGEGLERWLDNTTTETEHKVQGRFL